MIDYHLLKSSPPNERPDERGLASIVVAMMLIILISLISLGFARLMTRALQQALANQLSAAASYAAESGIGDAAASIANNKLLASTSCGTLLVGPSSNLSGNGATAYTCVLIDPTPASLVYQKINPQTSQVIKLTAAPSSLPVNTLMFSWQSSDRSKNTKIPSGQTLDTESQWGILKNEPLLRVTLYPVGAGGDLTSTDSNSRTYFFYPNSNLIDSNVTKIPYNSTPSGTLVSVNCDGTVTGSLLQVNNYACNVIVDNLPNLPGSTSPYYLRITPLYNQTDLQVKGLGGSPVQLVEFRGVQSIADVTAKAGTAIKRLQARVDIGDNNNVIPEESLRSANAICKRILYGPDSTIPVNFDSLAIAYCNMNLP